MGKQNRDRKKRTKVTSVTDWLLITSIPSIRYLTLRHLLGRSDTDPEVIAVGQVIKISGPIPVILAEQTEAGNWTGERGYYTPKYTSTHWSMLLLTELAADGTDPCLRRGAAFMLSATEDGLREKKQGYSCFWGNVLRYALHCGFQDDNRTQDIVGKLTHDALEAGWCCPINDDLPCAWGVARALWGLAAIPKGRRTSQAEVAIRHGITWLLEAHDLTRADYPTSGRVHPLWFRLNFPLFYQADILFVLRVLAELEALDHPDAQSALEWLAARRKSNGRWRGASPFRRRTWAGLADREDIDRWVTLQAALVIQQASE